jgi:putative hydrolase of the HAD superfamily
MEHSVSGPKPHKSYSEKTASARQARVVKKRIEAVTFDVGGTLIQCWPSVGHVYADVAASYGHRHLSPAVLNRRFKLAWQNFKRFRHTHAQWAALVDTTFQGLIEPLPSKTFFPQLFERFAEPISWQIFDDVIPTLEALKASGLRLGIISNWDDRLRPLLRKLRLQPYFQTIVVSCEVGPPKPSPRMFATACDALGCNPGNTLHVGDSRKMDFQGALEAGLQARWLRRGARRAAAMTIAALTELNKL